MIAQMSLVSLSVKLALLPGVVGVLGSSIVRAGLTDGWGDGVWFFVMCARMFGFECKCERKVVVVTWAVSSLSHEEEIDRSHVTGCERLYFDM